MDQRIIPNYESSDNRNLGNQTEMTNPKSEIVKKVMYSKPKRKRKIGRPKNIWVDGCISEICA